MISFYTAKEKRVYGIIKKLFGTTTDDDRQMKLRYNTHGCELIIVNYYFIIFFNSYYCYCFNFFLK